MSQTRSERQSTTECSFQSFWLQIKKSEIIYVNFRHVWILLIPSKQRLLMKHMYVDCASFSMREEIVTEVFIWIWRLMELWLQDGDDDKQNRRERSLCVIMDSGSLKANRGAWELIVEIFISRRRIRRGRGDLFKDISLRKSCNWKKGQTRANIIFSSFPAFSGKYFG